MDDLVQASPRLRPDCIILGELRGCEAASFLRAVNTEHPGSITTLHADSPDDALDQLSLLVLQSGLNLCRSGIQEYVRGIVEFFVQVSLSRRAPRDLANALSDGVIPLTKDYSRPASPRQIISTDAWS